MVMMKTMFALGALTLAIAAPAAAQMAAGSLPKCSATVRDSCDQSMTSERNAMSAAQAEASGGVGDRKSDQSAKASGGGTSMMMHHKMMMHHHHMHHAMHHTMATTTTTADTAASTPK